jgi:hypothetical protein
MSPFMKALVVTVVDRKKGDETQPRFFAERVPILDPPDQTVSDLSSREEAEPFSLMMTHQVDIVRKCGETLYQDLEQNDQIRDSLRKISSTPEARTPIYLRLRDYRVGNLPWEALRLNDGNFHSLASNGHIARLGKRVADPAVSWDRWIEPSLRVLVILAAAPGRKGEAPADATGEWARLWPVLNALGPKVRVYVLVCQSALASKINSLRDPRIQCEVLVSNQVKGIHRIVSQFAPNIIHFFCHGAASGQARLELANLSDYDLNASEGSIRLPSADLAAIGQHESVWLLTLNCCKGAHAPGMGAKSIAGTIADNGVPAVVAMRDDVNYNDAHIFSGAFYQGLVEALTPYLPTEIEASEGRDIEIPATVWVEAMHPSRAALSGGKRVPETWAEWTLPVVYVQEGPMRLKARPRTGEAQVAAQAASVASTPSTPTPGIGEVAQAGNTQPMASTRVAKFVLRLEKLGDLRTKLIALDAPAEIVTAFDAEITKAAHEFATSEREDLLQSIETLKATKGVSAEILHHFFFALDALNDKLSER